MNAAKRKFMSKLIGVALLATGGTAFAAGSSESAKRATSVTAITEVFGDGQKVTAVAVEYDKEIDTSKLAKTTFTVQDRTIVAVYANTVPEKNSRDVDGKYAIIELSPTDKDAALFVQSGRTITRKEATVSVVQSRDITAADGEIYPAASAAIKNDTVDNLVVDDFQQLEYKDLKTGETLKYNLFVPRNYDANKSYPLVMFIHDAGVTSDVTDTTLVQGLGAVVWATPEEQRKHECFVLAPQYSTQIVNDNSEASQPYLHLAHRLYHRRRA